MSNHVHGASPTTRPDPNAAVRRELAHDHHSRWPLAWFLVLALGGWLTAPGGLLAASRSSHTVLQNSSPALHWSAGWTVVHSRSASGGAVHVSGKAGASASLVYYGAYLQILAQTGHDAGRMQVILDGTTTSVSTQASTFHPQEVVFRSASTEGRHVLTIRVAGTAGHPLVAIDAIVVSAVEPAATPVPPVSGQKVVQFAASGTQAQFLGLMKDMSVDVIEMQPGTYRGWHLWFDIDRTARPLTIRPAAGGSVIFDDAGGQTSDGLFYPGWSSYTSNITFQGPFQITNYTIGQTGLVSTAWAANLTFNGFTVRGTTAPTTDGQTAWVVYVASDGTHRGTNLTFNDWNVDNTGTSPTVNGMQFYHTPQAAGVTALRWTVTGGYWAFVGRGDATGLDIESWTISGTSGPSFDSQGPSGVVKNMDALTSGSPIIQSPMVNGGSNIW